MSLVDRFARRRCSTAEALARTTRPLDVLPTGEAAPILGFDRDDVVTRRLFDLGFVTGAEITRLRHAPMGDPIVVRVADYEIALRRAQAACITVLGSAEGHDGCADCARAEGGCAPR